MKFLQNMNHPEVAITSLEIAEVTDKQHSHVMRDIRKEIENLGELAEGLFTESTYTNSQNKQQPCFALTKRGAMQLALKYDAITRYKILDHVEKLEEENALLRQNQPKPSYMIDNPAERARAWALEYEEKEALAQTVQLQAPKADYTDKVLASEGLMTTTEIAKDFGLSGVRLNKILAENNIIYRKGNKWFVYSDYDEMGLTKVHVYAPNQDNVSHTLNKWTQQGYKFVVELLQELGYVLNTEKTTEE